MNIHYKKCVHGGDMYINVCIFLTPVVIFLLDKSVTYVEYSIYAMHSGREAAHFAAKMPLSTFFLRNKEYFLILIPPQSNNAKFNPELANVRVHSFNTIL